MLVQLRTGCLLVHGAAGAKNLAAATLGTFPLTRKKIMCGRHHVHSHGKQRASNIDGWNASAVPFHEGAATSFAVFPGPHMDAHAQNTQPSFPENQGFTAL